MRDKPEDEFRDFETAAPDFAHRVRALFDAHRHKTIATLRAAGSPRISGIEAVFEDLGDKLIRSSRASASAAYRRAAAGQRAFAGFARSPDEGAARMAEASRIEGKAQA